MLRSRVIAGVLLVLGVLGGAWLDARLDAVALPDWLPGWLLGDGEVPATLPPGIIVLAIVATLIALAASELTAMCRASGVAMDRWLTVTSAWLGLVCSGLLPSGTQEPRGVAIASSAAAALLICAAAHASRRRTAEGVIGVSGCSLLAFVYLGLMPGFMMAIRREHGIWVLVAVLLVTKSSDIGAYAAGRVFGRRKLIPWASPAKTWEGLAGGIGFSMLVGGATTGLLGELLGLPDAGWLAGAIGGGLFAVIGQLGDLVASLFKRDAGTKDAGRSIPGFGGVLDVLDSLILVSPAAYWALGVLAASREAGL